VAANPSSITIMETTSPDPIHPVRSCARGRIPAVRRTLLLLALASLAASPVRALTLHTSQDTYSLGGKITAATGKATSLVVSSNSTAFVRFDFSSLPTALAWNKVRNARLCLYLNTAARAADVTVHAATSDWTEGSGTVSQPAFAPGLPIATIPAAQVTAQRFVVVDVTGAVRTWVADPQTNYGFALTCPAGSLSIPAKEGASLGPSAALEIDEPGVADIASNVVASSVSVSGMATAAAFAGSGADLTSLNGTNISPGTIPPNRLAGLSIGGAQLAPGAVQAGNLAAGAVGPDQLAANAVTAVNLAPGAVGRVAIGAGAVGPTQLAANAVTAAALAPGSVTAAALAPGAVQGVTVVGPGQLATGAVQTTNLADGSVTLPKLAPRTIGAAVGIGGVAVSYDSSITRVTTIEYYDVPNLTVTLTTTGRPVFIGLIPDGSPNPGYLGAAANTAGSAGQLNLAFCRDGAQISSSSLAGYNGIYVPPTSCQVLDLAAPAGTHTYKMQASVTTNCWGSINYVKMVAYEF